MRNSLTREHGGAEVSQEQKHENRVKQKEWIGRKWCYIKESMAGTWSITGGNDENQLRLLAGFVCLTFQVVIRPPSQVTGFAGELIQDILIVFACGADPTTAHLAFPDHLRTQGRGVADVSVTGHRSCENHDRQCFVPKETETSIESPVDFKDKDSVGVCKGEPGRWWFSSKAIDILLLKKTRPAAFRLCSQKSLYQHCDMQKQGDKWGRKQSR